MRKIRAAALFMGILGLSTLCMAADLPSERPAWCQKGYVCLPTTTAADLLIKLDMMEAQVGALKAKRARAIGWAAVCGPAASLSSTESGTTLAGTISCTVGFGYRF